MLSVATESNNVYNSCTHVSGTFNNKTFELDYYFRYDYDSYKVSGDFTEDEKEILVNEWYKKLNH